jgi:hypothetical protein
MIKVSDYSLINGSNGVFQTITFVTESGNTIKFTVSEDCGTYFDANTSTIDEIKKAIAMIESGKIEIGLLKVVVK